jgi:hypothetical protein
VGVRVVEGLGHSEVRDSPLVLTYAEDETATLAASELYDHEFNRHRRMRNGILASAIASSYVYRSMVHGVGGGRGPGTAAQ